MISCADILKMRVVWERA